jgi:hypothetical protein
MRATFSTRLLLRVLQATPEELAAIERILGGQVFPDWPKGAPGSPAAQAASSQLLPRAGGLKEASEAALLAPQRSDQRRYALQRGQGACELTYQGEHASFRHSAGTDFIDYYLKHPRQSIHPLALLAKVQGQDPVQQRSAALDDANATREYLREMERLRGVIVSDKKCDAEKKVAREELAQLEQSESYIYHRTFDKASRAAKNVRQAIHRVIQSLGDARDAQGRPHRVLNAFADHLKQYLLGPSRPGCAPTGHLVYEPPPSVIWA